MTLGMDPSLTNFGWAVQGPGFVDGGLFHTSSKTLFVDRYIEMRANVRALIQRLGIKRMGIEYPIFHDIFSEGMYGLFLYTCEALKSEKVDVVFFSPGQIKAYARENLVRPKGWKMQKSDMVEAAKLVSGFKGTLNHNIADAFWVASLASRFWQFHDSVQDLIRTPDISVQGKLSEILTDPIDIQILEGAWESSDLAGVAKHLSMSQVAIQHRLLKSINQLAVHLGDYTPLEVKQFSSVREVSRGKHAGETEAKGIMFREDERFFCWSGGQ